MRKAQGSEDNMMDKFNCEQAFKRLDDYLDRELPPEDMERIREHLEVCAWCAQTYEFQAEILIQVREKVQRTAVPDTLRAKVLGALRQTYGDTS
jgi:anti-sigma factor (TIGR02949 family)